MQNGKSPSVHPFDIYRAFLLVYGVFGSIGVLMAYKGWFDRYLVFGGAILFTVLIIGVARGVPDDFESRDSIVRAPSFGLVYGIPPGILSLLGLFLIYDNVLFFGFSILLVSVIAAVIFPGNTGYKSIRRFIALMFVSTFCFVMVDLLTVNPGIDAYVATQDWLLAEDLRMVAVGFLVIVWAVINEKLSDKAFDAYEAAEEETLQTATQ